MIKKIKINFTSSLDELDTLIKQTRTQGRKAGLTKADIKTAIYEARHSIGPKEINQDDKE